MAYSRKERLLPESPCLACGKPTVHTEDDKFPLCPEHQNAAVWWSVLTDIVEGRLPEVDNPPPPSGEK
jgi:hypothetical protein